MARGAEVQKLNTTIGGVKNVNGQSRGIIINKNIMNYETKEKIVVAFLAYVILACIIGSFIGLGISIGMYIK
jgi:hypothetical protein